jgi:transposase
MRWLCLRPPTQLEPYELNALHDILEGDARLALGHELLQRSRHVIARRSVRELDQWLADAEASDLRPFVSLSHGIQADRAAVVNGLTLPRSTGPVEGTLTKVKIGEEAGLRTCLDPAPEATDYQRSLTPLEGRALLDCHATALHRICG